MKEIWKDIPEYEGLYQASNFGKIKALKREWIAGVNSKRSHEDMILKIKIDNGYQRIMLTKNKSRKMFKVSRLVLTAFKGKSTLIVNHIDGNKLNDNLENLEYCTLSENVNHAVQMGLIKRGGQGATLTEDQVRRIKFIAKYTNPPKGTFYKIAKSLNVNKNTIYDIVNNRNWKHIEV